MPYRQLFRLENGAYIPVRIVLKGRIYYDPFDLTIHMNSQVFDPDLFPHEYAETLSWADFLELQFFKLEVRLEKRRGVEEMEQRRIAALVLRENIISFAGSMSKIYSRRKLMEKSPKGE